MKRILVTGAGGFIGHHLVKTLKARGNWVRSVDLKHPEYEPTSADEFLILDLREKPDCLQATNGVDEVYALAADMGGVEYISRYHARILHNNILINTHTLEAARENGVNRYLFASSACVYPEHRQTNVDVIPLKEEDALPAQPQDAYGWEKLIIEQLCMHYRDEYKMKNHIVRLHNIFGPQGTWEGGREKAPAALSRKVAMAKLTGTRAVEIWGDGKQTRSFCYIDDCVIGMIKLMHSNYLDPINLGQDRLVTINGLVEMIASVANLEVIKEHIPGPQGVRGRNSDNTRILQVLNWQPVTSLEEGLAHTYSWIETQVQEKLGFPMAYHVRT